MTAKTKQTIALSTGGTGGHIFPAQALAKFLNKHGYKVFIIGDEKYSNYINSKDNIEYKIIKTGKSLKNIKDLGRIFCGFFQSLYFLLKEKPDAVVGFGSYATFPFLCASVLLKKKILLHEQNSYLGKVNYVFGKYAKSIMTVYREMYGIRFKDVTKINFVGNPVRDEIKQLGSLKYKYPNKDEKFNILILAGSGGATFFGKEIAKVFKALPNNVVEKIEVVQQCRENDIEDVKFLYKEIGLKAELKTFFTDVDKKIKNAHLIISRAGSSIFEFAIAGKPMILIPSPNVKNDHQTRNAKQFTDMNAGIAVAEKNFEAQKFANKLEELLKDKERLLSMANNAREMAVSDADKNILDEIKVNTIAN